MELHFSFTNRTARRLLVVLVVLDLLFLSIFLFNCLVGSISGLEKVFDLDEEGNIPAWFSAMQLLMVGAILLVSALRHGPGTPPSKPFLLLWGSIFVFASMDEAAAIHERMASLLRHVHWLPRFEGDHGIWIPFYLLAGALVLLVSLREVRRMLACSRRETLIALAGCAVMLTGGIGLEVASYLFLRSGSAPVLYQLEVAAEEFLEMLGVTMVLYGSLLYVLAGNRRIEAQSTGRCQ